MGETRRRRAEAGTWIGHSPRRREDYRLVTGGGAFVDDHQPEGCLHLAFVRSELAHGRIVAINREAARQAEGIVAVYVAADLAGLGEAAINRLLPGITATPMHVLARDIVTAAGQPIVAIAATSAAAAADAAQLVEVQIDPLPLIGVEDREPVLRHRWAAGDVNSAFKTAAATVSASVEHALLAPMTLEPRAALACFDADGLTAWLSTQTPHRARDDLARMLDLPVNKVRVIAPDVGGAFGGKASIYPEDVMVAWAAKDLCRPVKWTASRSEDLLAATHGRGGRLHGELALDAAGTVLGLRARLTFSHGGWMPFSAAAPARNAGRILPGPYRVEAIDVSVEGFLSHGAAVGIYRGAGRPEAAMLMERLMDAAARRLAIDPLEIRRRNLVASDAFAYRTPTGETLDSGNYAALLERLDAHVDYHRLRSEMDARRKSGEIVGLGLGFYIEPCGQGWESASISLCRDGSIVAATGSSAQGQGRETAFAQIVAETLRVVPERVSIRSGDTQAVAEGIGALASRSTAIGGGAMLRACEALRAKVSDAAGEVLQCAASEIVLSEEGLCGGGGQSLSWEALGRQVAGAGATADEPALTSSAVYHAEGEAWSSGCCLASVAIDRDTGTVAVERLVWIDDAGRVLNPMLVKGQLVGGMAQGFGEAMMERLVYDDDGQLLTGSLMDYAVPRADDVPQVEIDKLETWSPSNPLGVKGVGEAGCIGVPAALVNAVSDALTPFGAPSLQMPLTSEKVWRAINGLDGADMQVNER
ncbi:xanthine dehydrogenase family protein molybdopterin-binding subunit [Pseudohoeflea sp. DP4N28-3]|uniref:Xanthine dehydrogenase family protein molybdopterin-binding subunit n=1 Tax=Pseudohoeflea coraliihabitans TaxID=2860393 RepID=A0ABS6WMU2_9HYPH|nr:xanthine dehydrogenase family protein molybdopterin-binding subunit [Pseudohoeflea sp. DP4N28-3]